MRPWIALTIASLLFPPRSAAECIDYANYVHWQSAVPLPSSASRLDVHGDATYVTGGGAGLFICDTSNKHDPRLAYTLDTPGSCSDVRASSAHAFVADGLNGLVIID